MRMPPTPPDWREALGTTPVSALPSATARAREITGYSHWDKVRRLPMPEAVSAESVWALLKLGRLQSARMLPLCQVNGDHFWYTLPDELLRDLDQITAQTSGRLLTPSPEVAGETRDRFIISSLMEEAITSSQLEGASTTRAVAKDMLRTNRHPTTRSERMILNNYRAMEWVRAHLDAMITPELIQELHAIVTAGTLDDSADEGRIQRVGDARIIVGHATQDMVLHNPPPASELPSRLEALCRFANGEDGRWMPRLLRAIICHFMVGYDHYFVDGNGRTARALFYWVGLKESAWLLELIPLSRVLRKAPVQYAQSYLHVETDSGDVTYFALHQAQALQRGLTDVEAYLRRKLDEDARVHQAVPSLELNHRQRAVIEGLLNAPSRMLTVQSHATSHGISSPTARADLRRLAELGFLTSGPRIRRQETWMAGDRLSELTHRSHEL